MAKGICSICSSHVCAEINQALLKKEPLRELAKRSGFSRAALSRHGRNCIARDTIAFHRAKKFNPLTQLAWAQWPDGSFSLQGVPHDFQGEMIVRLAFTVAIGYAGVVAALLVAAWHFAEPEGLAFDLLFIGFPWSLAYVALPNHSGLAFYFVAVFLNTVTVYAFALALVKIFSSGDQPNSFHEKAG
jgi:hypothetical protein